MNDITNTLLGMTTGISFALYTCDPYDKMVCDAIAKYFHKKKNNYTLSIDEFYDVFNKNEEILSVIDSINDKFDNDETIQINTIIFIYSLIESYPNLKTIQLFISNEPFQRITPNEDGTDSYNFYLDVSNCVMNLCDFFDIQGVEIFNKTLIKKGYISNNYLERQSYIHIPWVNLIDVIEESFDIMGTDPSGLIEPISEFFGTPEETIVTLVTDYLMY